MKSKKAILISWTILLVVTATASATVLDAPGDLDLKDVVKAINFGNTTDQVIGGVTFRAAGANSTVDGVKNIDAGAVGVGGGGQVMPNIGSGADDNALEQILGTSIYGQSGPAAVKIVIDVPNGFYRAQLIIYDGYQSHSGNKRDVNHYAEGTLAATHYHDYAQQKNTPDAGSVASYVFEVIDGQINLKVEGLVPSAHLSGLIVNKLSSPSISELRTGDTFVA